MYKNSSLNCKPPPLKIGDLTIPIPIIQGGMGIGISMSGLASAVAREGAVGVIAAVMIGFKEKGFYKDPKGTTRIALEKHIKRAKELAPNGIIGVNIMVALTDYDELVRISAKAGADLIISGAGLPLNLPALIPEGSKTKLVPIVSSGRAASILCRRWGQHFGFPPHAIVVEGPKAGGHLGFKAQELDSPNKQLKILVKEVIESVRPFEDKWGRNIPVIAAGGIFTGADMYEFLSLGASGVQMATRFVATYECDASERFKQAYIDATKDDIVIIKSPVGLPGRALNGPFIEKIKKGKVKPHKCTYHCLKTCNYKKAPYCISMALINAQKGNLESGFVFCGENVWRVNKIISVKELISEILQEYSEAACP